MAKKPIELKHQQRPPKEGAFIAYKKVIGSYVREGRVDRDYYVLTLLVPASAQRVKRREGNEMHRMRVSGVKVLAARRVHYPPDTIETVLKASRRQTFASGYDPNFAYKVGETAYAKGWDGKRHFDPRNVICSEGIHCFATEDEAKEYDL